MTRLSIGLTFALASASVLALCAASPAPDNAIPPVVLQGCAPKTKPARCSLFGRSAQARGGETVGFDVSFVNTTDKPATLVLLKIGDTTFAKTGTFAPGAVIAWRLAAQPGPCSITAVRFADGTEWDAPQTPAP